MNSQVQLVIVYIILGIVIAFVLYTLLKKKPDRKTACFGCSLADSCRKKQMLEMEDKKPESCSDCPETSICEKKGDMPGCGGNIDKHYEKPD